MYQPKDQYKKISGTINLLSEKSEKEITRVLNIYDISLEEFNDKFPYLISREGIIKD